MKYAHIFVMPGKKARLVITNTPALCEGVVSDQVYDSKADAKQAAKAAGAKAWNF
jgi:hypothetical protein